jgi:hypothetical protein
MTDKKYTVRARIKRPTLYERLFTKYPSDKVVYEVLERYSYTDDPSYGNGGGIDVEATRVVAVFGTCVTARFAADDLNKLDGTK